MLLWRIYVASNNRAFLGFHVKRPIFLPDFYQFFFLFLDKLP